jgi:hypothetical protein
MFEQNVAGPCLREATVELEDVGSGLLGTN